MKRSSKSKRYVSIVGLLLAFCFSVFMFTGCSSNSVTPEDQNPVDEKVNYLYETGEADKNFAGPGKCLRAALTRATRLERSRKLIDEQGRIFGD
ncbi:MAG: hypothetical protein IPH59_13900 [bacterium]|nr:hypothetical protein [bacterium]